MERPPTDGSKSAAAVRVTFPTTGAVFVQLPAASKVRASESPTAPPCTSKPMFVPGMRKLSKTPTDCFIPSAGSTPNRLNCSRRLASAFALAVASVILPRRNSGVVSRRPSLARGVGIASSYFVKPRALRISSTYFTESSASLRSRPAAFVAFPACPRAPLPSIDRPSEAYVNGSRAASAITPPVKFCQLSLRPASPYSRRRSRPDTRRSESPNTERGSPARTPRTRAPGVSRSHPAAERPVLAALASLFRRPRFSSSGMRSDRRALRRS